LSDFANPQRFGVTYQDNRPVVDPGGMQVDLTVNVERPADGTIKVTIVGQLDVSTAPYLRDRLIELFSEGLDDEAHVVVDLREVPFLDSTGVGVLVGAYNRIAARTGTMSVIAHPRIRPVLQIAGLDRVWTITEPPATS
jgi:anti-sigma B factor antagonist